MINSLAIEKEMFVGMEPSAAGESFDVLVRSRQEVVRLLTGIMSRETLMSISFLHADYAAVTSLIYIDEPSNMLLLECPPEWRSIIEGGDAGSIMLACVYEDSKIQFQGGKGALVELEGTTVVGLDIPQFMWRFQRRRSPRQQVPGLTITLNLGFIECDAEVTDLGLGGVGMFNCDADVKLAAGEVLHGCAIALPGVGAIVVDLAVRHQTPMRTTDGRAVMRVGCEFTGLDDSARQLIAHYLDALADV